MPYPKKIDNQGYIEFVSQSPEACFIAGLFAFTYEYILKTHLRISKILKRKQNFNIWVL